MVCSTVRDGVECTFMTAKGCSYNGGSCREITEQCKGCGKSFEYSSGWYCSVAPDPFKKWKMGTCNLATHIAKNVTDKKAKINPLKASKRGSR